MAGYMGLEIVDPELTGAGGLAIQNNFIALADFKAQTAWTDTRDPDSNDDISDVSGSRWLNITAKAVWTSVDNTMAAGRRRSYGRLWGDNK